MLELIKCPFIKQKLNEKILGTFLITFALKLKGQKYRKKGIF